MLRKISLFQKPLFLLVLLLGASACVSDKAIDDVDITSTELNVGILMIGDSGNIEVEQSKSGLVPVSSAIKQLCKTKPCDFGVMAGDNIYPMGADGLSSSGLDESRFKRAFEDPFGSLLDDNSNFRIYMALGNHDWYNSRAGAMAQLAYAKSTPPMAMGGLFYSVKPPAANGSVEVFVIDTEMLLSTKTMQYHELDDNGVPFITGELGTAGHKNALPQTAQEKNQWAWFAQALNNSSARWKIVLAHHPLWESRGSKHQQATMLRELVRPVVCEHADVYVAGHQHTLEVVTDDCSGTNRDNTREPLIHLVSGAAGKARDLNPGYIKWLAEQFPSLNSLNTLGGVWGYMHGTISETQFKVDVYAADKGDANPENYEVRYSKVFEKK